jgi:tRNA 5-methylaminomethyl-2-thiouridine biosynthesis bifunctional protein
MRPSFRLAETGFGTGLNFLVTAYYWLLNSPPDAILEYISIEKYPLSKFQLKQIYSSFKHTWPHLSNYCDELLSVYPNYFSSRSINKIKNSHHYSLFNNRIQLTLIINDATVGLQQINPSNKMDAWYLDGFSPAKNPQMWHSELFNTLAQLSKSGTTLSTFTSAGRVRRGLIEAGFTIYKISGQGKKREILAGIKK